MKTHHFTKLSGFMAILFFAASASAQKPNIGGFNVYYGSLHNHSNVSDGLGTPDQAYNYAKNTAHLDFFGLSDHSYLISSSEWSATKSAANIYNEDGVFTTFYGFEWTTLWSYGHVSVFNTEDYYSATTPFTSFNKLLSWVNARDAVAFFNHPGWDEAAYTEFDLFTDTPSDKFVGMELWNDKSGFSKYYYNDGFYSNDGMKGYFDEALIRGWKIGAAGADDNHSATWGTTTDFRVGVLASNLTRAEIMAAFKARRYFSSLDKNLTLSFTINGSQMGSTIQGGTLNLEILAADGDGEIFDQVVLFKNGSVVKTWTPWSAQPVINEELECTDRDYFYVRVKQSTGDEAISSPIFISGSANLPPLVTLTYPANGSSFAIGEPIQLMASASDADGISKVEFYQGTVKLGEVLSEPYQITWNGASAGSYTLYAKAIDNKGAIATSETVSISVVQTSLTAISQISGGKDDAEESKKGVVDLASEDIDMVFDTKLTGNQWVGLLFRNLNIPQGAIITKAHIQFTTANATTGSCALTITGQAAANPPDFTSKTRNISSRVKTTSNVLWIPESWNTVGEQTTVQQTPDIKTIVQEIVNRADWSEFSNMVMLISGTGTRTAESYEGNPLLAARIHVEYSLLKSAEIAGHDDLLPVEQDLAGRVSIYPNPVIDNLTILTSEGMKAERVMIYNLTGTLIREITVEELDEKIEVDCSLLKPGLYLLGVQNNRGNHTIKFIKQ